MNLSAALCFTLLACVPAVADVTARDCGTVIIPPGLGAGVGADVESLNPIIGTDTLYNQEASYMMFEQLIWISPDHTIDWSRSVASAVTTPDEGKTYNITLRPWHWSDGTLVTADDVAFTLAYIRKLGPYYPGYGTADMPDIIASLQVDDARHLTITLQRQVNPDWFILNGLSLLIPMPAHDWGRYTVDQIYQLQSTPSFFKVIDGPLRIEKLDIGLDAIFTPNAAYDGPKMHFDRLIIKFMDNEDAEMQAVESGELDAANVPFPLWDEAQGLPGLYIVPLGPSYSWHELIPNMGNKTSAFFGDVRVRDAMADAINQPQMINLAMHGQGLPVYGPVPPEPAAFLSPAARAGDYPVGYNPAKARALLAAAGYRPGRDGVLQKGGVRLAFTLLIPAGQPMRTEMAEAMQQNLRAVGIEMQVHEVEFNQIENLLVNQPQAWQAILIADTLSAYPTGESQFVTGAYFNNNGYSSPAMDSYVNASTNKPGMDGLFAFEDFASAQQPVIFLPVEKYALLTVDRLHGLEGFINPLGTWAPDALWCTAQ